MCFHVVVDQFAYPLGILVDLAAGAVVVFGILHHALEVAFNLGDSVVATIADLVFDSVYGDWQFGEIIVVWQLVPWRKGEELGSDWTATVSMRQFRQSC